MAEKGKRIATKDTGVYVLTSTVKRHNGKPDQCYYITYKDAAKRKVWEKIGWRSEGVSQASAIKARQNRMQEKGQGVLVDSKSRRITFKAAYDEFEAVHLSSLKEYATVKTWANDYVLPRFGQRTMNSITTLELERFKAELFKKGLSAQSVKHILGLMRRVYNKATAWGLYNGPMPVSAIKMPKTDAARMRYLTKKEAETLLEALHARDPLWHDIALLALYTGIRFTDIVNLRVRQINFESGFIDVIESKPGTYTAYYPENVRKMLLGRVGRDRNALLFPSGETGETIRNCGKAFLKAVNDCKFNDGVTDTRYKTVFHTLRHTFASWLAQEGVSITIIAELMGHATTAMTQRYAKLSPDSKKEAINRIKMHTTPAFGCDSET